jgi:hypothetical protein
MTSDACQAVWETAAAFVGDVVQIGETSRDGPTPSSFFRGRLVRLRLTEAFRGNLGGTVDVRTGNGGGDCGFNFIVGQRYLVYATETPTGYYTGICQRTRLFVDAAEDLKCLRSLSQSSPADSAIVGFVNYLEPDAVWVTPFAGALIVAEAGGRRFEGLSGGDGRYRIPVPVGSYRITVEVPERYYVEPQFVPRDAVVVRDTRGCATVNLRIQANGRIAGRVVDSGRSPIAGLSIEAQAVSRIEASTRAVTNAAGEYELAPLHPGTYILGVYGGIRGANRIPLTTAGGTGSQRVAVGAGLRVVVDDLELPASVTLARLTGAVRLPDGRPAAGAKVYLRADSAQFDSFIEPATVDAEGRFSIAVPAGKRHRLFAELLESDSRRVFTAESPGFEATPGLEPFDVRLTQK